MYPWHPIDDEDEVLDVLVQATYDKDAALGLMCKLLKDQRIVPTSIVTDPYRAYDATFRDVSLSSNHRWGKLNRMSDLLAPKHSQAEDIRLQHCRPPLHWLSPQRSDQQSWPQLPSPDRLPNAHIEPWSAAESALKVGQGSAAPTQRTLQCYRRRVEGRADARHPNPQPSVSLSRAILN